MSLLILVIVAILKLSPVAVEHRSIDAGSGLRCLSIAGWGQAFQIAIRSYRLLTVLAVLVLLHEGRDELDNFLLLAPGQLRNFLEDLPNLPCWSSAVARFDRSLSS